MFFSCCSWDLFGVGGINDYTTAELSGFSSSGGIYIWIKVAISSRSLNSANLTAVHPRSWAFTSAFAWRSKLTHSRYPELAANIRSVWQKPSWAFTSAFTPSRVSQKKNPLLSPKKNPVFFSGTLTNGQVFPHLIGFQKKIS